MNAHMIWNLRAVVVSAVVVGTATLGIVTSASAGILFSNGFETDTAGWNVFGGSFDATRVASGTNGITSATGSFHAETDTAAGNWGGYGFNAGCASATCAAAPFQEYKTSVDIYLDVDGGWDNNTRFDFSSAINEAPPSGDHLRDFIFNAGFYDSNDTTGPGAGIDRFIISASNNSQPGSAFAKNPDKDPIAIDESGWYTFMHHFYDDGGVLAVDMTIMDASQALINTWTLSNPADLIPTIVGGNRYGWFDFNEFSVLAFDNTFLEVAMVPEPGTLALFGLGLVGLGLARRRTAQA